jgi:hypothetical protein
MKLLLLPLLVLVVPLAQPASAQRSSAASTSTASGNPAADSMQRKIERIQSNAQHPLSSPVTTVITEQEVNAYVASSHVRLPVGVQSVRFSGVPGVISSASRIDFDQLTSGQQSSNPMLGLFRGIHDVTVSAQARGAAGIGEVHVNTVELDGIEVPRFVLQMFVDHYLKPKYPEVGLDTRFRLPARIDSATIGEHKFTVVQK